MFKNSELSITAFVKLLCKSLTADRQIMDSVKCIYSSLPDEAEAPYIYIDDIKYNYKGGLHRCSATVMVITEDTSMKKCHNIISSIENAIQAGEFREERWYFSKPQLKQVKFNKVNQDISVEYWAGEVSVEACAVDLTQ